ncbi:hypothetical protein QCN29_21445 [Streptomyces sp. HNM0663]|uniref:Uncharacterized protein n=1 Tax=Streptomyces chengmaiensis TaxID=3040919 RepID=A0ABT6HSG2_9ACTN|nr:hypothetical protein [Streptomyces chengmaiensis]MDH2391300.1 hypothetical protein [Streptomyces chengmaiensis]
MPVEGTYVVDVRTGTVGRYVGQTGHTLRLRPLGGGREWVCTPEKVRPATASERISAQTAYENARSRGEVP